jgi:SAM-dependent methyltransferase
MGLRKILQGFYRSAQKVIVPDLKYSQETFEEYLKDAVKPGCSWLDLGCGHQILPEWRLEEEIEIAKRPGLLIGLDYDMPSLMKHASIRDRIRGDISLLPFADDSFDLVTSNMVFEHLEDPEKQLREICRILKPGGALLFHTPNARGYATRMSRMVPEGLKGRIIYLLEGRTEDDVFTAFYRINDVSRIGRLAEDSELVLEEVMLIPSVAVFQMVPPLVIFELMWIRLTMTSQLERLRTNIIVRMRKKEREPAGTII